MRIARLLSITTYLLNRNIVTGNYLAKKFEVSERTIQRDIEAINMAGIPIISLKGVGGGYQIMDTFKLLKQPMKSEDMNKIVIALKGLESVLKDKKLETTIEKLKSVTLENPNQNIINVDYSAVHENLNIDKYLKLISESIIENKVILIRYVNNSGSISNVKLEPVLVQYKWYAWYLVAYNLEKQSYRIYKLSRIQTINKLFKFNSIEHIADENLFDNLMKKDSRIYLDIEMICNEKSKYILSEYLPNMKFVKDSTDKYICNIKLPEDERMWFAIILSLGDDVKVLKPKNLIQKLKNNSNKIINLYDS